MATETCSSNERGKREVGVVATAASGMMGPTEVSKVGLGEARLGEGAIRPDEVGPGEGAIRWGEAGPGEAAIRLGEARWTFEAMRGQLEAYEPGELIAPRFN